ncbi:3-hydroxyacyl-CoA dehydrogenase [Parvularcula oceani]|uniref:3-hydroxyacyl-CoA dehydrogenase n=1 Tax=Parvularcula oceani TaxID=1247963 RepID=UPI0004E1423D|nr:3-hydroxyacyl-CoA dehydrogenase [Parvularcula oceani]
MDIQDKVAVVTGGASGIGEANARRFAELGAKVAIFDRDDEKGETVAGEIGDNARYYRVDVTKEDDVAAAVKSVVSDFGAIHICMNFAGIAIGEKTVGKNGPHALDSFRRVIDINLVGTFNVLRLCAEVMSGQDPVTEDGQRGVIVNTASVAAYEGQMGQAAYSASKGGIVGMTLPIARDLAQAGIRCNTIVPGLIHTPLFDAMEQKVVDALSATVLNPRRLGKPDEIARTAQWIVETDYVNGESIRVDGGIRMQPR